MDKPNYCGMCAHWHKRKEQQYSIDIGDCDKIAKRTCDNCGSGDMFKHMHENTPSAPDNAAGEFLLYLLEQIPLDTLIAYVAKRKEKEDARADD